MVHICIYIIGMDINSKEKATMLAMSANPAATTNVGGIEYIITRS